MLDIGSWQRFQNPKRIANELNIHFSTTITSLDIHADIVQASLRQTNKASFKLNHVTAGQA